MEWEALFYYLMFAGVMLVQQKILGGEERIPEILAGVAVAAGVMVLWQKCCAAEPSLQQGCI